MLPINKQLININYSKGVTISPQFIVIHETDNEDVGANAMANRNYFANHSEAQASTHFVVDDKNIIQCLELNQRGWHVGDNRGHSNITNSNTVGIEICVNSDGDYNKARANTIELTKYLMGVLKLGADRVVRHYDSSGKHCPRKMLDNPALWNDFKAQLGGSDPAATVVNSQPVQTPQTPVQENNTIKIIQQQLNTILKCGLAADGINGPKTDEQIKRFQGLMGLGVDGIWGPRTAGAVGEIYSRPVDGVPYKHYEYATRYIQFRVGSGVDGTFGNGTKVAVQNWQARHGLVPDGIVGAATWRKLLDENV
jgi:N-acetyl-anhydromuramyl-L-alanine amidase AmpD